MCALPSKGNVRPVQSNNPIIPAYVLQAFSMSWKPPLALVAILALLAMHDLCVAEDAKQNSTPTVRQERHEEYTTKPTLESDVDEPISEAELQRSKHPGSGKHHKKKCYFMGKPTPCHEKHGVYGKHGEKDDKYEGEYKERHTDDKYEKKKYEDKHGGNYHDGMNEYKDKHNDKYDNDGVKHGMHEYEDKRSYEYKKQYDYEPDYNDGGYEYYKTTDKYYKDRYEYKYDRTFGYDQSNKPYVDGSYEYRSDPYYPGRHKDPGWYYPKHHHKGPGHNKPKGCRGNPTKPDNGAFSCSDTTRVGDVCYAICDNGYTGRPYATCRPDCSWGPVQGSCELKPRCIPLGDTCVEGQDTCCGGTCQPTSSNGGLDWTDIGNTVYKCCNGTPLGGACSAFGCDSSCCIGWCGSLRKELNCSYFPANSKAERTIGSLSGATLVRTKEVPAPIPLSEVTTGQHVPCLGDLADLTLTPTTRWCEVKNFLNANEKDLQQFEIEVSKPGAGSVKLVANGHMMVAVLVQTGAQVKDTDPPALTTGGAYKAVPVVDINKGDRLLLKADHADMASGWVLGTVTKFELLMRGGYYKPAIDAPYMLAGDFVVAMYDHPGGIGRRTAPDVITAATLAQHQLLAPLYTQHLQPLGTPARTATWDGKEAWPHWGPMRAHIKQLVTDSNTTVLADTHTWFKQRHEAWLSMGAAVSTDDVARLLPTETADDIRQDPFDESCLPGGLEGR